MLSRNEPANEVLNKNYFLKDFKVLLKGTGILKPDSCCLHSFMFLLATRIKRTMLKIADIEN